MARIRISNSGKYASETTYHAIVLRTNKHGSIDKTYISEAKRKEVDENEFAYVNQPAERVV